MTKAKAKKKQDSRLSRHVRSIMVKKGLTLDEVAAAMGVSAASVSTTLRRGRPTTTSLKKIAEAIDEPAESLLEYCG